LARTFIITQMAQVGGRPPDITAMKDSLVKQVLARRACDPSTTASLDAARRACGATLLCVL
jgi:hypothetical protein